MEKRNLSNFEYFDAFEAAIVIIECTSSDDIAIVQAPSDHGHNRGFVDLDWHKKKKKKEIYR